MSTARSRQTIRRPPAAQHVQRRLQAYHATRQLQSEAIAAVDLYARRPLAPSPTLRARFTRLVRIAAPFGVFYALGLVTLLVMAIAARACGIVDGPRPIGHAIGAPPLPAIDLRLPLSPLEQLQEQARQVAEEHQIPPRLFAALILTESSWRPTARGEAGEYGLTQLTPRVAASLGITDPFDVRQNLTGGARHLRAHFDREGNWTAALVRYNGRGPKANAYAQRVLRAWERSE